MAGDNFNSKKAEKFGHARHDGYVFRIWIGRVVPRIKRNPPVSPGTAAFAIVPYMKAHSPRAAIYSLRSNDSTSKDHTGKAVAVPRKGISEDT